jgi:hypothetical protein
MQGQVTCLMKQTLSFIFLKSIFEKYEVTVMFYSKTNFLSSKHVTVTYTFLGQNYEFSFSVYFLDVIFKFLC